MRYAIAFVAAAASVAASPAPQAIDFNAIQAAPAPSLTQAPVKSLSQTGVYNPTSATASAAAAVSSVASASATASVVPRGLEVAQGELEKRWSWSWCFWPFCNSNTYSTSSSTTTAATATSTTASSTKTSSATTAKSTPGGAFITVAGASTTAAPSATVPSTCTPISWTNTFAFITTDTACPQPYEVGTYCGFINPEDPCVIQPSGAGPQASPDTPEGFLAYAPFHSTAKSAATPQGYAQTFVDLNAAVSANSYLGLHTLNSYDVQGCSAWCDNTTLCTAFNIYMERDPVFNPDQCSCTNPGSITNYKCTLWGSGVESAAAVNSGQTRSDFKVVITGSNGYEKTNDTTPVTPSGWTSPQKCGSKTHDHPSTCMGTKFFPGPYDPSVCAAYANSQNAKNTNTSVWQNWWYKITGYNPLKCSMFNSYMIKENGVAKGTHCKLFSQQYQSSYANYMPGWSSGKFWGIESSYTFNCAS